MSTTTENPSCQRGSNPPGCKAYRWPDDDGKMQMPQRECLSFKMGPCFKDSRQHNGGCLAETAAGRGKGVGMFINPSYNDLGSSGCKCSQPTLQEWRHRRSLSGTGGVNSNQLRNVFSATSPTWCRWSLAWLALGEARWTFLHNQQTLNGLAYRIATPGTVQKKIPSIVIRPPRISRPHSKPAL